MAYQVPKENHPWRRYQNKAEPVATHTVHVKPIRVLVTEIIESWEKIEVNSEAYGRQDKFNLVDLPQRKQAEWIINLLRRYQYASEGKEYDHEEEI